MNNKLLCPPPAHYPAQLTEKNNNNQGNSYTFHSCQLFTHGAQSLWVSFIHFIVTRTTGIHFELLGFGVFIGVW